MYFNYFNIEVERKLFFLNFEMKKIKLHLMKWSNIYQKWLFLALWSDRAIEVDNNSNQNITQE